MSTTLTAVVAAVMALSSATPATTVETVTVAAVARYDDPCASPQLVGATPKARPHHKIKRHLVHHVVQPAVKKPVVKKLHVVRRHKAHKKAALLTRVHQTCGGPAGAPPPVLDFTDLLPTAAAPSVDSPAVTDAAATMPDTLPATAPALLDDGPFVSGFEPGGLDNGIIPGGGGSPGGGGGGGAPGGGGGNPGGGGSGPGGPGSGGGNPPGSGPGPGGVNPPGSGPGPGGSSPTPPTTPITPIVGVPEPATWASMLVGFAMLGAALRRRRPAIDNA